MKSTKICQMNLLEGQKGSLGAVAHASSVSGRDGGK